MNSYRFPSPASTDRTVGSLPVAIADADGMVWAHSNPAELYRWVSRRNELLKTIAAAYAEFAGPGTARAMAG